MPSVDDKDVEWDDDDDDDLDFNEDMSEEEVKRIMQSIADKKQNTDNGAGDLDVSGGFENVQCEIFKDSFYFVSGPNTHVQVL